MHIYPSGSLRTCVSYMEAVFQKSGLDTSSIEITYFSTITYMAYREWNNIYMAGYMGTNLIQSGVRVHLPKDLTHPQHWLFRHGTPMSGMRFHIPEDLTQKWKGSKVVVFKWSRLRRCIWWFVWWGIMEPLMNFRNTRFQCYMTLSGLKSILMKESFKNAIEDKELDLFFCISRDKRVHIKCWLYKEINYKNAKYGAVLGPILEDTLEY